jgi:type IV secretion system protein VirD4
MLKVAAFVLIGAVAILFGYPCVAMVSHGFNFETWPAGVMTPAQWFSSILTSYGASNGGSLLGMAMGQSPAFAGGGLVQLISICAVPIAFAIMLQSPKKGPRRDPDALQGDARWATLRERSMMKAGVQFGRDLETGEPIRVAVEGNVLTIAPPRRRKTSGLIIPNLVAMDEGAWNGPVVVLDPKGDAFRATSDRRRALGKTVRCLDPMNI